MPLSARERLKAEVESMLLAGNVRPDVGAAHIPVASTKESNESKGADVSGVADRAAPEAISEADAAVPAKKHEGASILIDVSDAAEPPSDVSEDTPRSTFNDAKGGALRSKLRNQGSFSFSGKHDAHRSPRPPPTPRGLEAPSTPSSQAAGMSHTERLRLMRESRQAAAEKLLHPAVRNPASGYGRGVGAMFTHQMLAGYVGLQSVGLNARRHGHDLAPGGFQR